MSARVIKDTGGRGLEKLAERLRSMNAEVKVGLPSSASEPDGLSSAQVGAWLEFGTRTAPARPWLRPGVMKNLDTFARQARSDLAGVAAGSKTVDVALGRLGTLAVAKVQEEITTGPAAPNATSTIAKKGSSVPRIDTGTMRASVAYEISKGGAR